MENKYAIDGLYLTQRITGIQRFAYEITKALDLIIEKDEIILVVPDGAALDIQFRNISVIQYGCLRGILWEQISYPSFLRKNKCRALCLTNVLPLFYRKGIITIHDVSYKANPQFFTGLRNRLSALWHCINYYADAGTCHPEESLYILHRCHSLQMVSRKYYALPHNPHRCRT